MKSDPSLKVGIVGSTYPREDTDTAVPWLREIVGRTADSGHDVRVIAPSFKGLASHVIDGIPVHRFRYGPAFWETLTHDSGAPNKVRSPLFKLLAIPYILAGIVAVLWLTWRHRLDVLHIHWPFPHGLMALLPALCFGTRVVSTCHGAELAMGRNSVLVRAILACCLKWSDVTCTNSSHTADEVRKIVPKIDLIVVPYGATVSAGKTLGAPLRDDAAVPTLLFCGRLIQRKGIDYLLKALPMVLAKRPVRLVITGEGDRKAEWMQMATDLGIEDQVAFLGFVSSERLNELYQTCDLYVHPAIFDDNGDTEGLGVVLVEALAHRKPVIASRVGGIVDVIKDGITGTLVPEKDSRALAEAIDDLLGDPDRARQLGEAGFAYAQSHFDWNRITDLQLGVYQERAAA